VDILGLMAACAAPRGRDTDPVAGLGDYGKLAASKVLALADRGGLLAAWQPGPRTADWHDALMGKIADWYRRLRGDGPLIRIQLALAATLIVALAIAVAVTIVGLHLLHFRAFKPEPLLSTATLYDLLKVAFAFFMDSDRH
jgi:hypothetical protein